MAASEVDFPDPVAPTTSTKPRLLMTTSFSVSGKPSFSKFGISEGMVRITMPTFNCCTNTLTRKRATSGMAMAKLHSNSLANSSRCRSFMMELASARVTSPVSFCEPSGCILPCSLRLGGKSFEMNRSEPPALVMARQQFMQKALGLLFSQRGRHYSSSKIGVPEYSHLTEARPRRT